ncbi:MFS transporter [Corynebacterium falsenii]
MVNRFFSGCSVGIFSPIRRTLSSNAVDATATQIFGYAIDIVVITIMNFTATQLGIMKAMSAISFLLLAVPIGSLVDRIGPFTILVLSLTLKALITLAVLAAFILDFAEFGLILTVVTLLGIVTVSSENAQLAMVPLLTRNRDTVTSTVARMTAADRIAAIGTPVLVGLVLERSSVQLPLSIALILFILAAIPIVGLLHSSRTQITGTTDRDKDHSLDVTEYTPSKRNIGHGFRVIAGNRLLFATILLVTVGNIGLAIGDSIVSILVLRKLDLGSGFFGVMASVSAVAGLTSALVVPRFASRTNVRTAFAVGALCQAVAALLPLLALIYANSAVILLLAYSISWSAIISFTNIVGTSYLTEAVRPTDLGRAGGARRMITMGAVPAAALGAGVLADTLSLAVPLIIWPTLTLSAAVVFFTMTRATNL